MGTRTPKVASLGRAGCFCRCGSVCHKRRIRSRAPSAWALGVRGREGVSGGSQAEACVVAVMVVRWNWNLGRAGWGYSGALPEEHMANKSEVCTKNSGLYGGGVSLGNC